MRVGCTDDSGPQLLTLAWFGVALALRGSLALDVCAWCYEASHHYHSLVAEEDDKAGLGHTVGNRSLSLGCASPSSSGCEPQCRKSQWADRQSLK